MSDMRQFGIILAVVLLVPPGCRRTVNKTAPIQEASAKPIEGAFGKSLGERWPALTPDAEPRQRSNLYVFAFTPDLPMRGLTRYRAWVLPATMQICRLTGGGDLSNDHAFAEFFQDVETLFGHLSPLNPAASFQPPQDSFWSATREGRTVLVVRRKDGRTTLDLFDVFLGSRPLEEILSAKGAQPFDD